MGPYRHYSFESQLLHLTPSLLPYLSARSFLLYHTERSQSTALWPAGGRLGRLEGRRRPQRGDALGLAAASHGRAWPRPATLQVAAAQQPSSARALPAAAASAPASALWFTAPSRAWGGGRGAVGILGGDAGGLQEKEQRWQGSLAAAAMAAALWHASRRAVGARGATGRRERRRGPLGFHSRRAQ